MAGGGGNADIGRGKAGARCHDQFAGTQVLSGGAIVASRLQCRSDAHGVAGLVEFAEFMHGDGIDPVRHHRAGKDPNGFADRNRMAERMSRRGPPGHRKCV